MRKHIKNIVVIGAPGSFKGFLKSSLTQKYGEEFATVSLGALTMHRLEHEPEFRAKHLDEVTRGDLLPDHVAIPMAHQEHLRIQENQTACIYYWDGVFRTRKQVEDALIRGVFKPTDTLILNGEATRSTCAFRYQKRADEKREANRVDDHSFPNRFDNFVKHRDDVLDIFRMNGFNIVTFNANLDLPTAVIPKAVDLASAFIELRTSGARSITPEPSKNLVEGLTTHQRIARSHVARAFSA